MSRPNSAVAGFAVRLMKPIDLPALEAAIDRVAFCPTAASLVGD